ncbi:MAG: DNA polymerase Y family protein [Pyrinomonadaceae bacterium]
MFACIHGQQLPAEVPLSDFAYTFSPLVEETAPDTVVIDVEGCALRFGSPYELASEIAKQAKGKEPTGLSCKVNVALAANPDVAIFAARYFKGITFIAPGEELNALGELPIEKLFSDCSPKPKVQSPKSNDEILETLRLWGVRTFKEFAELPMTGVSERLGQNGLKLRELASGKTNRPLKLRQSAPEFKNAIELDYPIAELEPLSFILARLLNQICANLNVYALATNALQVKLKLEHGPTHEIKLNLPYPMRDHKVFLKLLLLDTEVHPPPAAVVGVSINCEPVKPRVLQTGLFIPLAPEPEKLELMLARLAKLVGAENIGSPELLDTHRPDAFRVKRFELKQTKKRKATTRQSAFSSQHSANPKFEIRNPKSILGFRVFRPPLRALVQAVGGCPREISAWNKNKSVHGKVVGVAGPWRTSGEWWRADTWARDEWDVAIQSSGQWAVGSGQKADGLESKEIRPTQVLYRIYRELPNGAWFVEGIYD